MQEYILHIGFSKCGSTWLKSIFRSSSEILLVENTHFFSPLYANSIFNKHHPNKHHEYFKNPGINKIVLESDEHIILPNYSNTLNSHGTELETVRKVLRKIKETIPNCKIIIVIRNHKSLLISRYSQYIVKGGKLTFDEFCNILLGMNNNVDMFQNYYFEIISYLYSQFSKENIFLIILEELKQDEDKILTTLKGFIGINKVKVRTNILTRRKGLSFYGLALMRKMNRFLVKEKESIYHPIDTIIPIFLYNALTKSIRLIDYLFADLIKIKAEKMVTPHHEFILRNRFREDNKRLSVLLNKPLEKFGYYI